jgi:hypothetical protein
MIEQQETSMVSSLSHLKQSAGILTFAFSAWTFLGEAK